MSKKTTKNTDGQADKENKEVPLQKDFAHYPPAPIEQVKPHAHSQDKEDEVEKVIIEQPAKTTVPVEKQKTVNGSQKIVNEVDESYSDGSGGGFEATEQVTD